jgi:outer membrane receptor protein involved in Fe transport
MTKTYRTFISLVGCVIAAQTVAFGATLAAGAAETVQTTPTPASTADVDSVAEIVVTAQRRSQPLQDVPVAVSVLSGDALTQQGLSSLEDVSARLPDVRIVSGPLTDFLNIRGVGSGQNAGFEQSVGTFVDGVYRGRSKSTQAALFDLDQVEILKGPQTTFFGNNAIAGAINITTRKPGDHFEYDGSARYTAHTGEYDYEGGLGGPVTDTLGIRLAGRLSGTNGYIHDLTTGENGPHTRDYLGRISLRWKPSDAWQTDARFDVGRSRTSDANAEVVLNCPSPFAGPTDFACPYVVADHGGPTGNTPFYNSYAPHTFANYDFHEAALTNTLDLGQLTLVSITGDFHHQYHALVQLVPVSNPGIADVGMAPSPYSETVSQFSQEFRLQSQAGGMFEYMVGAYYSTLSTDVSSDIGAFFLPFGAFNPLGTTDASTPVAGINDLRYRDNTWSGFASATIKPIERLRINLGARFTAVHKDAHREDAFGAAPGGNFSEFTPFDPMTQMVFAEIFATNLNDFVDPTRTDKKFMPSAGLQYDLTDTVMGYFTFSRGFKAGGFSGANEGSTFGPENVNAYEVGLKSELWDRRLILNGDVFRSDYTDLQETLITFPGGIPVSTVANAAASRAQGIELSASLRMSRMLSFSSEVAYLDSRYQNYPSGVCTMEQTAILGAGCVQDMSGKRRPYSPDVSGNVSATLSVPITAYELRIQPLVYFTSSFFTVATADPLLRQPGYAKVDLRASFGPSDQHWEVAVLGKNLTDRATAAYRNPLTGGNGSVFAYPDPPRTVAVQVSFKH